MRCAVKNCNNHNKSKQCTISFFTFPSDAKLLKEWKSFCGRDKKMNVKTSQICMEHFKPDDFENNLQFEMGFSKKRFLKRGAVPTINKVSSMDEKRHESRTQRIQRRENKKIVEILIKEYDAESALVNDVNEPPVQDTETKLLMDRQFLQEPVELWKPQKENFLKNNYEQNETECFNEEMCVGYNIEMENLKEEIERLHKENSALKEISKKQTAELKYLMEKRDEVLKMNNKRDKYTSKLQLEAMVDLMKLNRDVACGFSQRAPAEIKNFWEDLALTLNGSGPPLKDASGWRKVWTDYKSGVKKKLIPTYSLSFMCNTPLDLYLKTLLCTRRSKQSSSLLLSKNAMVSI